MPLFRSLKNLYRARVATPLGSLRMLVALLKSGQNLMALLQFAAYSYPSKKGIIDDNEVLTFKELYQQTKQLAQQLRTRPNFQAGSKVAILCRNHAALVKAIFACSYLKVDVYLLNPDLRAPQFNDLAEQYQFDALVYDLECWKTVERHPLVDQALLSYHLTFDSIDRFSKTTAKKYHTAPKGSAGRLIVLTSGTTGMPKSAARKPDIGNFQPPLFALLEELKLQDYSSVYIGIPISHGFGLAGLIVAVLLGSSILTTERFEVQAAATLLLKHRIQVLLVVPTILDRFVQRGKLDLIYIRCILTGGAPLPATLLQRTLKQYTYDLANLYGTSEAGFSLMAKRTLLEAKPHSIGYPIAGVRAQILDDNGAVVPAGEIGRLQVQSTWTANDSANTWIETGDLAAVDSEGAYQLYGRTDDRIVSGGENVYPIELERLIQAHPEVVQVSVIGVADETFGERLKAFVVPVPNAALSAASLLTWLKEEAPRYMQPRELVLVEQLPKNALGKVEKDRLT